MYVIEPLPSVVTAGSAVVSEYTISEDGIDAGLLFM